MDAINNISVMIVDDSKIDRMILCRILKSMGISDIFEMEDGSDALAFLREYEKNRETHADKFPPLAIFLDINMPIVDGFDFLDQFNLLRQQYDYGDSQIFMYTSSSSSQDLQQSEKYRFVSGYFVKGLTRLEEIEETLKEKLF